jgi:cytoskeleton protein RodZ
MNQVNPDESRLHAGEQLRVAREAAGLTQADVAARLKMPLRVVRSLEEEDWSRLGAPVFVRGQLRSYARLLGIAADPVVEAAEVAPVSPPVLTPRTFTPPLQRLAEQVARRFVYVVMTAAIAIPVWLATRPQADLVAHDAAPLDVPATQRGTSPPADARPRDRVDPGPRPLVASLAPLPQRSAPGLVLSFEGDSWMQVIGEDGETLEQTLVRSGEERSYDAGEVTAVVLGNAAAVEVRTRGKTRDLAPYMRANVARFTVSSDGSLAPAAD